MQISYTFMRLYAFICVVLLKGNLLYHCTALRFSVSFILLRCNKILITTLSCGLNLQAAVCCGQDY